MRIVEEQGNIVSPKEDLTPYAGKWVLLRDGLVLAHADEPMSIVQNYEVIQTDLLMPIPHPGILIC